MKKTYIKWGIWHLGVRKKQKGGFLHILGTLARPLLVSGTGAINGEVLKGLGKKFGGKKTKKTICKKTTQKDSILLCELTTPRPIKLPNSRVFFCKIQKSEYACARPNSSKNKYNLR